MEKDPGNPGAEKDACWHHNAKVHAGGPGCRFGDKCRFDHSVVVSKKVFESMKKPNQTGKGEGHGTDQPPKGAGKAKIAFLL